METAAYYAYNARKEAEAALAAAKTHNAPPDEITRLQTVVTAKVHAHEEVKVSCATAAWVRYGVSPEGATAIANTKAWDQPDFTNKEILAIVYNWMSTNLSSEDAMKATTAITSKY